MSQASANRLAERAKDLVPLAQPYFAGIRVHTSELRPGSAMLYIYPFFTEFRVACTGQELCLDTALWVPFVFYDLPRFDPGHHPAEVRPAIRIRVKGKEAGWYLPDNRTLILSDWTHDFSCVQVAQELFPRLVEWLRLKPLTKKRRRELLREAGFLPSVVRPEKITLGCDPEFEFWHQRRELENARHHLRFQGAIGTDGAGHQVELRPAAGSPVQVVRNLRKLFAAFSRTFPSADLDAAGNNHPCGGHIHIGGIPSDPPDDLVALLDDFVGYPTHLLNGDARGDYGDLGDWREQPHGIEYRTPPAAIFANPRIARITLKLTRNLVARFYSGRTIRYEEPPSRDDYVRVGGLTTEETEYFLRFCSSRVPDHFWIRAGWNLPEIRHLRVAHVEFQDGWLPERIDWFRQALQKKRLPAGTRLVLYGLSQDRGNVATIPGIPGLGVLSDPPCAPVAADGSIWIGLPWCVRQDSHLWWHGEFLQWVVDAIARYCRRVRRGGDR